MTSIDEYQMELVEVVTAYGRPPTAAAHLRKLGEEVGELAEAVANNDTISIVSEVADVVNVVTSLLDQQRVSLNLALQMKLDALRFRIQQGHRDRKYGSI